MPALQHYFKDERLRRGWSVREAATRSQISVSKAYAIEHGDDNVELETFENIATAFGLTPAELYIAIGKGPAGARPDEVELVASYRRVASEQRPFVLSVVHGLAGAATNRGGPTRNNAHKQRTPRPVSNGGSASGSELTTLSRLGWISAAFDWDFLKRQRRVAYAS